MKRYFLACSALLLGTMACWAPKALADDSLDVPFDGVVYEQCLLSLVNSGQLETNGGPLGYEFTADDGYGVPAQITADCNGPAMVTAAPPVQTAGPALSVTGLRDGFGAPVGQPLGGNNNISVPPGLTTLNVGMFYDNQSPIPGGTYGFNVTVTATPY